jgi:ABC-2 type transport system ATP-binding protein
MDSTQPVIHVEHLRKTYGSITAVDDVTFDVQPGEIFGIIGPNGAGKTTIIEILAGMRQPSSGQVCVLGLDPQRQVEELRQRSGVQLQSAALPDKIRVWEALDLFASFYRHAPDYHPLLKTWGLSEKCNATFDSLSGGQQQRLFIALALVNDPELVFLDELTSGLDPQARRSTWELIREIRARGKTVILVTHFMDEAEKLCDRIAIIDQGKLVALDRPQNLIENIHSETRVKFTVSNGFDPANLHNIPGVTRAVRDGDRVTVFGANQPGKPSLLLQVASTLGEAGLAPVDLRTEQPTLEDVFITLMGREIQNEWRAE